MDHRTAIEAIEEVVPDLAGLGAFGHQGGTADRAFAQEALAGIVSGHEMETVLPALLDRPERRVLSLWAAGLQIAPEQHNCEEQKSADDPSADHDGIKRHGKSPCFERPR